MLPNIPLMRALILADKGSYEAARTEINRVLSAGRGGASAHYARAAVAFEEGRVDAAEDDADRALELDGDFAAAHMLKGRILEERGNKSAARTRFDKALGAASDSFDGRTTRRVAKERLSALGGAGQETSATATSPRSCSKRKGRSTARCSCRRRAASSRQSAASSCRLNVELDPCRHVIRRLLPGAGETVDAGGDEPVGRLRRQQQMIDADAVVLLEGAGLIVPERVDAGARDGTAAPRRSARR